MNGGGKSGTQHPPFIIKRFPKPGGGRGGKKEGPVSKGVIGGEAGKEFKKTNSSPNRLCRQRVGDKGRDEKDDWGDEEGLL